MSEKYFLGAVCGGKFRTEFPQVLSDENCFTYILKGGAGTGKSSLMKRVAEHFEHDCRVQRWYCSSDPDSLDAVVIPEHHAAICDGTAPHVFEPIYPGVSQQYIDLGRFWDRAVLSRDRAKLTEAADANKALLASSSRYNEAASVIFTDTLRIGEDCLDRAKSEKLTEELSDSLFKSKNGSGGRLFFRRLTALTGSGVITHYETAADCKTVYLLRDELSAASDALLKKLADLCVKLGFDAVVSPSQLVDGTYQHLVIPELSAAFLSDTGTEPPFKAEPLELTRLYRPDKLTEMSERIAINKRFAEKLSEEASHLLREAKAVHDVLENIYISAMDFSAVDTLTSRLISEIEKM